MQNFTIQSQKPIIPPIDIPGNSSASSVKAAGTEENAAQAEKASDEVVLTESSIKASDPKELVPPRFNKLEAAERATNDVLVHLVASDTPAVLSIWANLGTLPHALVPALGFFNAINTATGVVSIAMDSRETFKTVRNPHATKMDKIVDVSHLVAGDVFSTIGSMVPLVAPLTTPVAMGVFVGGQLMGLGMDIFKSVYDAKRKGQQSAY